MVVDEILGGLKIALAKGESLQKAMMTFYSAGYKKEDIENAARMLQGQQIQQPTQIQPPQQKPQPLPQQPQQIKPQVIQNVSDYTPKQTKPKLVIIFILIFVLIVLLGILIGLFLFKEELIDFFNNLF